MRSNLIYSKLTSTVRCALSLLIFFTSFQTELTSAAKLDRKAKPKREVSVSLLQNLPVVSITKGTEQLCTGVLVSPKSILTSKLCIKSLKKRRRKGGFTARIGSENSKIWQVVSSQKLNVGIVKLKNAFKRTKPTKLFTASRMAFGKDFVVAGLGKELAGEIGYLNATYLGSKLLEVPRIVSCFGEGGMPALVRRPTAVVGVATYGFGECFFDSEVTFENVGSAQVQKLVKSYS